MDNNQPNNEGVNDSSRASFEQLGFINSPDDTIDGTGNADRISGDAKEGVGGNSTLPGPLAYWSFDNFLAGLYEDAKGGPGASVYQLENNTAVPITNDATRAGTDGTPRGVFSGSGS